MSKKHKFTRKEAEDIMETEVRNGYFWADTRNKYYLQDVIDTLYNSIQGNDYLVECVQNQNSERLKVVCGVCKTVLSSYDPFISHQNGKSHKKVLQQILCPKDPNLDNKVHRKSPKEIKGIFLPDSLEDAIDTSEDIIIGVQFLYKEVIDGEERFTCELCKKNSDVKRLTKMEMLRHLQGRGHPTRYLEKKFGYSKVRYSDLDYEIEKVADEEGCIHGDIVDFTKQIDKIDISGESTYKEQLGSIRTKLEAVKIPSIPKKSTEEKNVGCWEDDFQDMQLSLDHLKHNDSIDIVAGDGDMQSLLIHFNWLLADRLVKYYNQHSDQHVYYKEDRFNMEEQCQKIRNNATKLTPYVSSRK
ncbi:uncharacterized protein LOC143038912 [Oratosquilla oratoria]|uniref:uncharacterized protein LOC143038912 n=1 Tax=Oratosquilla oratoria TaxID=337810 RepID=UPI003F77051A